MRRFFCHSSLFWVAIDSKYNIRLATFQEKIKRSTVTLKVTSCKILHFFRKYENMYGKYVCFLTGEVKTNYSNFVFYLANDCIF